MNVALKNQSKRNENSERKNFIPPDKMANTTLYRVSKFGDTTNAISETVHYRFRGRV